METVLLFKNDLERYSNDSLRSLQWHLGVPNAAEFIPTPVSDRERLLDWARENEDDVRSVVDEDFHNIPDDIEHFSVWELEKIYDIINKPIAAIKSAAKAMTSGKAKV